VPDELRSPIKHHLVLHRIDPEQRVRRFYSLMIERDLFGTVRLVRNWGRIGTNGQELVEVFANEDEAGQALEAVARAKHRRGYRDQGDERSGDQQWQLGIGCRRSGVGQSGPLGEAPSGCFFLCSQVAT
jgi:predicted DNA-binding WGR domain protein